VALFRVVVLLVWFGWFYEWFGWFYDDKNKKLRGSKNSLNTGFCSCKYASRLKVSSCCGERVITL
jgi:hypothetical protein